MKSYFFLFLLFFVAACKPKDKTITAENDLDAARSFIQSALYGDYQKARKYMLPDSANEQHMNAVERVTLSPDEKRGLAEASIRIINVSYPVKDSVTIVIYSNSYKNNPDTLKVVRQNDKWLVDFKYLYEHDADSLYMKKANKDTFQ